jgi:hypothetical protein
MMYIIDITYVDNSTLISIYIWTRYCYRYMYIYIHLLMLLYMHALTYIIVNIYTALEWRGEACDGFRVFRTRHMGKSGRFLFVFISS